MMEAVARQKAHWLFGSGSEGTFSGKRRPQEDMVTSAVFGSIRLLSPVDRRKALWLVLGAECFTAARFPAEHDIEIDLWKRLPLVGRRDVEPDVLLTCERRTLVVEVKWKSSPGEDQIEHQIEAAMQKKLDVAAVMLLGHANVGETGMGPQRFHRTWRDVTGELGRWPDRQDDPLDRWVGTVRGFLLQTDVGRIFTGLSAPVDPGRVAFRFSHPGHTPWLDSGPAAVELVHYAFEGDP